MTPRGEDLKEDSSASPSTGQRLPPSLSHTHARTHTHYKTCLSFRDGDQHWCRLWEKCPRREGSFKPHRLPGHGEAAGRPHHGAQRADQHQILRLLLPQHPRERPVPGLGTDRTQVAAEVGLGRAAGGPTQVHVPAEPGPAALPVAARVCAPHLPLAGRAVLLLSRGAAQRVRPVVRERGECYIHLLLEFPSW